MKKVLFFTVSIWLASFGALAQSWNITGNNNATPTSILGNTNSVPLRLFTKNVARIVIDTFGFVGINSAHPVSTLDVRGTQFLSGQLKFGTGSNNIQFANPTSTSNKPMMLMFTSGTTNLPRMVIAHSTSYPDWGLQYDDAPDRFNFIAGGLPVFTVDLGAQNVGIRTTTPAYPLSFDNNVGDKISLWGNAGPHYGFGIQSGTLQMHTDGSSSDIVFGYGQSSSLTETMRIKGNGTVSVGGPSLGYNSSFIVRSDNSKFSIIIENTDVQHHWDIWHSNTDALDLFHDGTFKGAFDPTTGAYTSISDARLKTNIKPMETMLDKINQLKPSSYQFKDAKDQQFYDGFIAQEVEKIFPNLIQHNVGMDKKEILSMNYSGFGVIAIKGIQELQDIIKKDEDNSTKQQDQIQLLNDKIKKLESIIEKLAPGQFQNISTTTLEQNSPNPARSSTTIRYSIPSENSLTQLNLMDNLGRTVKSIHLNSSGRIDLDVSTLSSGTYTYSLVVDGKIVDTKKLVIAN